MTSTARCRRGNPDSIRFPWDNVLDDNNRLKAPELLFEHTNDLGLDPTQETVVYGFRIRHRAFLAGAPQYRFLSHLRPGLGRMVEPPIFHESLT
ncbi:MAG: hypothetical protein R2855_01545 [Thermomicrobiales bacterium]